MKRKSNRPTRSGVGGFPTNAPPPVLISLYHPPLHSSDEWEAAGRPFWCVGYPSAIGDVIGCGLIPYYARTLTATFCPVALVATLPMYARGVYVGACGRWEPAEWCERRDYKTAARDVRPYLKYNPVSRVAWDAGLTADTVQQYARAGDIGSASDRPASQAKMLWRSPWKLPADDDMRNLAKRAGYLRDGGQEA